MANNTILSRSQMEHANQNYEDAYMQLIRGHQPRTFHINPRNNPNMFRYLHICSIERKHDENPAAIIREQMQKVLTALWTIQQYFQLVIRFDGSSVKIFAGTYSMTDHEHTARLNILRSVMEGAVSGITFETRSTHDQSLRVFEFQEVYDTSYKYMGMFAGHPVVRDYPEQARSLSPIDEILIGSTGMPWMLCIHAVPVPDRNVQQNLHDWNARLTECSECVQTGYSIGNAGPSMTMNTTKTYSGAELYREIAKAYLDVSEEAMQCGQWQTAVTCFAPSQTGSDLFGGMLAAQLKSGDEEIRRPLPFRYYAQQSLQVLQPAYQTAAENACTALSSRELAAIAALPVRDTSGFQVTDRADFDVHREAEGNLHIGSILNGQRITDAEYRLDLRSLNRHALIIGLTGGGKTNTVKSLLHEVSAEGCPFMVIEPAKKEYYELFRMGMSDLQVYSVGSHDGNTLKINPFEVVRPRSSHPVPLQSHIDTVFAAFKASFIMYTPMPYVLETAIYEIYRDYGWDVETGENRFRWWEFPTIEDLYYKIEPVVKAMGYDAKMQNDLIGSLKARINSLRLGTKGQTLNVARSTPMEKLLSGKVVIELDDVGDEEAKAFVISLLLMQIQECRKVQDTMQLDLQHLLLIEEAHRLLKNVTGGTGENADPRANAVEHFCNMLAELRSKGQGFMVIDQIPSKLAPDLIKNTNLKIIHRTVAEEDRVLVGGAMHMDDSQKEYLSCLGQGVAAVYSEGDHRPKLVKLPYAGDYETSPGLSREEIIRRSGQNCMKQSAAAQFSNQVKTNAVCRHCRNTQCAASWSNPHAYLSGMLGPALASAMEKKICGFKEAKDALTWLYQKFAQEADLQPDENQELRPCMMAAWLEAHQKVLNYSAAATINEHFVKRLNNENRRTT